MASAAGVYPVHHEAADGVTDRGRIGEFWREGEHTELALMEVGLEWKRIEEFKLRGAIA
jgi:hypothetical protein